MKSKLGLWALGLLYVLTGATVVQSVAQPGTCTALVTQALNAVGSNCSAVGRNTACYGFNRVDTRFATTVEDGTFSLPSDTIPLIDIVDLHTQPFNLETEQWGVAVMNVQANIPNTLPGQAVTFLLLGDTQVQNDVAPDVALTVGDPVRVLVTAGQQVNLRGGPATTYNVAGNAAPGQPFDVDARSADADWLRLSGFEVWLARSLVTPLEPTVDLSKLPVATDTSQSPMQAFYFRTGLGTPICAEAPDVLVLQGPEAARVRLSANGAEIELGSTAVLQSTFETYSTLAETATFADLVSVFDTAGDASCLATTMILLEGDAVVNGEDAAHVPLGHRARSVTCLDSDGVPAFTSPWGAPERLTDDDLAEFIYVEGLPLPRSIKLPTQTEIDASIGRGPNIKPTPTRLPLIAVPTRIPPTRDPNRPTATATPDGGGTTGTTPSCEGFRATAPFGAVDNVVSFYWDAARHVYGYQLEITVLDDGDAIGGSKRLFRIGSTETSIAIDLRKTYSNSGITSFNEIRWRLQVLILDANSNPTTLCETGYTVNPVR
jgi:hypothetical protein